MEKKNICIVNHACGNNTSIDLEVFTEYITSNITEQINKYYSATSISKEYYAQNVYQNIENEINNLQKEKENIARNIDKKKNVLVKLYDDKVNEVINEDEFNILKESNSKELERLKYRIADIEEKIKQLEISMLDHIDYYPNNP